MSLTALHASQAPATTGQEPTIRVLTDNQAVADRWTDAVSRVVRIHHMTGVVDSISTASVPFPLVTVKTHNAYGAMSLAALLAGNTSTAERIVDDTDTERTHVIALIACPVIITWTVTHERGARPVRPASAPRPVPILQAV